MTLSACPVSGPILVPPAAPLGRLSESTTETTHGETPVLNARWATEGVLHMNSFSPALGVDLVLCDEAYAIAALSWWWSCRVTGPGLC